MQNKNNLLNKSRILIVDNDPVIRHLMKESLLSDQYIITEAENGHDAIDAINRHTPDIVLLDVKMPEMSGFEVCSEIRKDHDDSDIAIIMMTGLNDSESIEKAFQYGATDFINKPINWDVFPYRVQYILKARIAFNELKRSKTHLHNMELISHIITKSENRDHILKNALSAILDIFDVDRSCIVNFTDKQAGSASVLHEALKDDVSSIYGHEELISSEIPKHTQNSSLGTIDLVIKNNESINVLNIFSEMSIRLHQHKNNIFFLSVHRCSVSPKWSDSEKNTFISIAERLGSVLSQHLLIENLHQSEDLLKQAQQIGHLGNWTWDIASDTIKWSDEVYKIYGKSINSFTPTFEKISNLTYKNDFSLLEKFNNSILKSGKAHSVEFRIIMPNNDVRYIYQQGIGEINSEGDVFLVNGTIQDITEHTKTTSALLESEARFRRLAENAPDVIFRISMPDEKFEYISPAATSIFGYTPEEFQDVTWLVTNIVSPENRKYFKSQWIETTQGNSSTSFEYSIQKKSRDTRWLNQHNALIMDENSHELIAIEGIIHDVSTKRRMHEKLLESERDMRGILSNLQDTFFRINTYGRIIMASESVNDLLSWTPFDLLGKKFGDLFISNNEYENFIDTLARSNGILVNHNVQMKRQNGDIRWISLSMQSSEKSTGYIEGTARDITNQLMKQEQEIHDTKMEAIGQFTSGVAHDFGNLMTIAKGNLELLNEIYIKNKSADNEIELLTDARSAIKDGVSLTKQLLAFSRGKAITPESTNAGDTLNNFKNIFKNTLGDQIKLTTYIQDHLPDIMVNQAQFESALINIVINARDAMPNGGQLSITASTQTLTENIICHVIIQISDSGIGMSHDVLQHATEPFYTTKKNQGTGLGLSMVYGFIQQSGAELNIISSPGKGTSIELIFPAYYEHNAKASNVKHNEPTLFNNETILIVEDRSAVRRFAVRCLHNLSLNIIEACNAVQAQEIMNSNKNIDLLFTDIIMPGEMNGRELASWARNNFPDLKILLTTAAENRANSIDCNDFLLLQKPYDLNELTNKIRELL